jgi:PEP-CTERM motif
MKFALKAALASTALIFTSTAQAAVIASLSFDTPFAIVASNAQIDVNVTLTFDAFSDVVQTGPSGIVTAGLTNAAIIAAGGDPNDVINPFVNVGYECSGSFSTNCISGPPYTFTFDSPGFIGPANLDLQPGSVSSYRFGFFTPTGGNAPAGTYDFFNSVVGFSWSNANNDFFFARFAETCPGQNPDCAFTREVFAVAAVPEPASWALMIAGFGLVGAAMRRRGSKGQVRPGLA